jgi:alkylated DNA repair dioxygenase AlkB
VNHYIGHHSDDTRQLESNSTIYSFSYGQTRDFVIQSKNKDFRKVISLQNNTYLKMGGEIHKYYKHSVPKRKNANRKRKRKLRSLKKEKDHYPKK